jgi:hypothetical protein
MLKKIAIGFVLLVLIAVAAIYGNYFFWKAIEDRDAVKKVNEQHAAADIEGDQIFRSRISSLQNLGIMGEKVAESKADSCYIDPAYAGFTTSTWEQFCQLNYLVGYTALLSREETFTRLETAALHKEDRTFPRRIRRGNRRGCNFSSWRRNNVRYVPAGSIPEGDDCRIPDPVYGIRPRGARMPGSTKFDYTFNPDAIDQSVDLLWITYTQSYYREDLGCTPLPLCSNSPRSKPIKAD